MLVRNNRNRGDGIGKQTTGRWSLQAPPLYTAASLSCGLLLLLPLLLLSWPPGDITALGVLSDALGAESLSPGAMWAGPGEDREGARDKEGRYAAIISARRSGVGAHFVNPAAFWRKSTAVPCTAR